MSADAAPAVSSDSPVAMAATRVLRLIVIDFTLRFGNGPDLQGRLKTAQIEKKCFYQQDKFSNYKCSSNARKCCSRFTISSRHISLSGSLILLGVNTLVPAHDYRALLRLATPAVVETLEVSLKCPEANPPFSAPLIL